MAGMQQSAVGLAVPRPGEAFTSWHRLQQHWQVSRQFVTAAPHITSQTGLPVRCLSAACPLPVRRLSLPATPPSRHSHVAPLCLLAQGCLAALAPTPLLLRLRLLVSGKNGDTHHGAVAVPPCHAAVLTTPLSLWPLGRTRHVRRTVGLYDSGIAGGITGPQAGYSYIRQPPPPEQALSAAGGGTGGEHAAILHAGSHGGAGTQSGGQGGAYGQPAVVRSSHPCLCRLSTGNTNSAE